MQGNYWFPDFSGNGFNRNSQPMIPQQQSSNFLHVHNRKSVDQFYVAPGTEALFMYEEEPVVAVKRVDMAGVYVINEYELVPRERKAEPAYVTREEFDNFVRRMTNESTNAQQQATTEYDATAASNAATGSNPVICTATNDASSQQ